MFPQSKSYLLTEEQQKSLGYYLTVGIFTLPLTVVVMAIWKEAIPFSLFQFWKLEGSIPEILWVSLPLFASGFILNFVKLVTTRNDRWVNNNAEVVLLLGLVVSGIAGIGEEIAFRWLLFYNEIWAVQFTNWLFFGFLGFGIPEWLYHAIFAPVANFFTLGILQSYLTDGFGWAVGAAIIGSNGKFRNGHIYQGLVGFTFSWFAGMFFFYIMFNYGLFAAIIVHFLFDVFVFSLLYVDAVIERALGWT